MTFAMARLLQDSFLKVSSRDVHPNAAAAATKLAGEKAQPALELVGYDQDLSAAMKYAFGGSFVCKVCTSLSMSVQVPNTIIV